jgi:hypothetical protein
MKETRVYVLDNSKSHMEELSFIGLPNPQKYERIMNEAEKQGNVYSLTGFQDAVNIGEVDFTDSYIYISNKPEDLE